MGLIVDSSVAIAAERRGDTTVNLRHFQLIPDLNVISL